MEERRYFALQTIEGGVCRSGPSLRVRTPKSRRRKEPEGISALVSWGAADEPGHLAVTVHAHAYDEGGVIWWRIAVGSVISRLDAVDRRGLYDKAVLTGMLACMCLDAPLNKIVLELNCEEEALWHLRMQQLSGLRELQAAELQSAPRTIRQLAAAGLKRKGSRRSFAASTSRA